MRQRRRNIHLREDKRVHALTGHGVWENETFSPSANWSTVMSKLHGCAIVCSD